MIKKIDVIIPTYNRADLIEKAIESVLNQTYQNFVLHIIDDGSTDATSLILDNFKNHPKVNYYHQENRGVSAARNFGALKGSAEWISFLDSDDRWLPKKLETQVDYLNRHPKFKFIHSEEIWIRNGMRVNPKLKHKKNNENIFLRSLEFCLISPSTVMIERNLFKELNGFDENFVVCEDYDLWLKILLKEEEIAFIDTPLIEKYGGHEDQLSTQYVAMDYWRIKSLCNIYNSHASNEFQKKLIKDVIIRKSELLLRNYLKHQKQDSYNEIYQLVNSIL